MSKENPTTEFTFNTQRPYTPKGQEITVTLVDTKECDILEGEKTLLVKMVDHSRNLNYLFEVPEFTRSEIMNAYDRNCYETPTAVTPDRLLNFWKIGFKA